MYKYKAFRLYITSDVPMPELLPLDDDTSNFPSSNILHIQAGTVPETLGRPAKLPYLQGDNQQLLFDVKETARFLIRRNSITYMPHPNCDIHTLRIFLLGACMAAVLQLHGYIVLHGNAISTDGKTCTVFVGHSGAGKSTIATWHFQRGAKILTDDVCAITFNDYGKPFVIPSFPQLKIWQHSADLLGINTQGLRQIYAKENKYAITTHAQFSEELLPLQQIFELQTAESHPITHGMEKLKCLITHSLRYYFLEHLQLNNQYGKLLLRLLNQVKLETVKREEIAPLTEVTL